MKINNSKDFGKAIAQARKSRNLTQQDLADYTGYSVSYISHLENGKASAGINIKRNSDFKFLKMPISALIVKTGIH